MTNCISIISITRQYRHKVIGNQAGVGLSGCTRFGTLHALTPPLGASNSMRENQRMSQRKQHERETENMRKKEKGWLCWRERSTERRAERGQQGDLDLFWLSCKGSSHSLVSGLNTSTESRHTIGLVTEYLNKALAQLCDPRTQHQSKRGKNLTLRHEHSPRHVPA